MMTDQPPNTKNAYQIKEDNFWRIVREYGEYVKDENGRILKSKQRFNGIKEFKYYNESLFNMV
jgi:hypothetical protein